MLTYHFDNYEMLQQFWSRPAMNLYHEMLEELSTFIEKILTQKRNRTVCIGKVLYTDQELLIEIKTKDIPILIREIFDLAIKNEDFQLAEKSKNFLIKLNVL